MSLTTELSDAHSPLARWCATAFAGTPDVVAEVRSAASEVRPVRPHARGELTRRYWAEIGGAWGQRVAELVQPAPPYGALLGMVRAGWVTAQWAHDQAGRYRTHRDLPREYRLRALDIRPAATGWLDVRSGLVGVARSAPGASEVWGEVLAGSRAAARMATGALGSTSAEAELARTAWLLSACEEMYRDGEIDTRLAREFDAGRQPSAAHLRGLVDEDQVTELGKLAVRLESSGTLGRMRALAGDPRRGQPLGIAAPTIVPHWADGDVLLGDVDRAKGREPANGTTLVDVKTVISLRDEERIARWLWQILGYAWLDTGDQYRIRRVGLLLARHGVLLTWPVRRLAEQLMGRRDPRQLARQQFRDVAGWLIRSAGGVFPVVTG